MKTATLFENFFRFGLTRVFVLGSIAQMKKTQHKPITVTEAAELIGCTRGNVLYLIRRGLVRAERLEEVWVWRLPEQELEALAQGEFIVS